MWTLKLLRFNQVPSDFREPFIISGYRSCRSSIAVCLLSAVQRTNETLNFWTHFLCFLAFAWVTWCHVSDPTFINDRFTWPFVAFLVSSCTYLLASAAAHLFNCMSLVARYVCFFFDYGAIGIYSLGCSIAYYAYAFPPDLLSSRLYRVYLPLAVFNALLCTITASYSRLVQWKTLRDSGRLLAFAVPYLWCSLPLLYRVLFCNDAEFSSDAQVFHVRQFLFALLTALFYATRFPEFLSPGTFDVFGHSHQFFHIGGALATYCQYRALSADMATRREYLLDAVGMPTPLASVGALSVAFLGNLVLVLLLSLAFLHPAALAKVRQMQMGERAGRGDGAKCKSH